MASSSAAPANANTTVLITGASRGIGLGLVEAYAKKGYRVIATARDPLKAAPLQALVKAHAATVSAVTLDVADSKSVAALPAALAAVQPAVTALDLLINNAGIISPVGLKTLAHESVATFADVYRTNVIGVWDVTQTLLPLLRRSRAPKVANISSIMGSVTITAGFQIPGLAASYRLSKAALNELSMVQSREYNAATVAATTPAPAPAGHDAVSAAAAALTAGASAGDGKAKAEGATAAAAAAPAAPLITVLALEPGWVDTDLGTAGGTVPHKPPVTVQQSAEGLVTHIAAAPVSAVATFFDYTGKPLPW